MKGGGSKANPPPVALLPVSASPERPFFSSLLALVRGRRDLESSAGVFAKMCRLAVAPFPAGACAVKVT